MMIVDEMTCYVNEITAVRTSMVAWLIVEVLL